MQTVENFPNVEFFHKSETIGMIHLSNPVLVFFTEFGFSFDVHMKQTVSAHPVSVET